MQTVSGKVIKVSCEIVQNVASVHLSVDSLAAEKAPVHQLISLLRTCSLTTSYSVFDNMSETQDTVWRELTYI